MQPNYPAIPNSPLLRHTKPSSSTPSSQVLSSITSHIRHVTLFLSPLPVTNPTFRLFPNLPLELRLLIFHHLQPPATPLPLQNYSSTIPQHRPHISAPLIAYVIALRKSISNNTIHPPSFEAYFLVPPLPVPITLTICRENRDDALRRRWKPLAGNRWYNDVVARRPLPVEDVRRSEERTVKRDRFNDLGADRVVAEHRTERVNGLLRREDVLRLAGVANEEGFWGEILRWISEEPPSAVRGG